jgi:hypothetical protein
MLTRDYAHPHTFINLLLPTCRLSENNDLPRKIHASGDYKIWFQQTLIRIASTGKRLFIFHQRASMQLLVRLQLMPLPLVILLLINFPFDTMIH